MIIIITLLLASLFIIFKGPSLENDSYSYIHMYATRPPGYPLFLLFLRQFGDHYLMLTVIVQTLMNAIVFSVFIHYLSRRFDIQISYLLFLLPLITYFS